MSAALLDHLWQSTLFALAAASLTLAFRANRAGVRFGLWFAASLKFLVPFAWLAALGARLSALFPQVVLPQVAPRLILIRAEPLADPARLLGHPQTIHLLPWLMGVWLAGMGLLLVVRLVRGLRLRAVVTQARAVNLAAPVAVKASASLLEPGLVGILNPVILFPAGLLSRLSDAEVKAILAHECGALAASRQSHRRHSHAGGGAVLVPSAGLADRRAADRRARARLRRKRAGAWP